MRLGGEAVPYNLPRRAWSSCKRTLVQARAPYGSMLEAGARSKGKRHAVNATVFRSSFIWKLESSRSSLKAFCRLLRKKNFFSFIPTCVFPHARPDHHAPNMEGGAFFHVHRGRRPANRLPNTRAPLPHNSSQRKTHALSPREPQPNGQGCEGCEEGGGAQEGGKGEGACAARPPRLGTPLRRPNGHLLSPRAPLPKPTRNPIPRAQVAKVKVTKPKKVKTTKPKCVCAPVASSPAPRRPPAEANSAPL